MGMKKIINVLNLLNSNMYYFIKHYIQELYIIIVFVMIFYNNSIISLHVLSSLLLKCQIDPLLLSNVSLDFQIPTGSFIT